MSDTKLLSLSEIFNNILFMSDTKLLSLSEIFNN